MLKPKHSIFYISLSTRKYKKLQINLELLKLRKFLIDVGAIYDDESPQIRMLQIQQSMHKLMALVLEIIEHYQEL